MERRNKMKKQLFLFMIISFLSSQAFSQSAWDAVRIRQNETGFGARTLAMGGNGVAIGGDYSSIFWNPAGLASLKHSEFLGELSHLRFSNAATFSNTLSDMDESYTRLRSLGLAVSLPTTRGSMVLALGYNFVRDFDEYLQFSGFNRISNGLEFELQDENGNYDWYRFDQNIHQTEEVTDNGGLHQWSFGGAVALSPNFDAGITLNFWNGKDDYNFNYYQEDVNNIYNIYPGDFHSYKINQNLITDYKAFSLKLGGMFKLNRATQIGLAMEFPTTFTVKENYSSSDELIFDDGYVDALEDEPGQWEYQVKTPYRFDAGVAFMADNVNLTAAATYRDWTQTRFEKPDFAVSDLDYSDLLNENIYIQKDYRETINYHLGGELLFPNSNFILRGGYAYYPSPLKDASPDYNKKVYSGGIGLKIGRNSILDVTYLRGDWKRESEDIYTPGGTLEDVTENRVLLGIRYQF